jgi:hypothetical protein
MKTPEEYYKSLSTTDVNCPIDKGKELNFNSFDMIRFTEAYMRDIAFCNHKSAYKLQHCDKYYCPDCDTIIINKDENT